MVQDVADGLQEGGEGVKQWVLAGVIGEEGSVGDGDSCPTRKELGHGRGWNLFARCEDEGRRRR